MASHGVPRLVASDRKTEEAREKERQKIKAYKELVNVVNSKRAEHELTSDALDKTSELLTKNPEYYSIWNARREILQHLFSAAKSSVPESGEGNEEITRLLKSDLQFLIPLLRQYPKCYWIWNHRRWDLDQATLLLPSSLARRFWQEELGLVGKMLSLDSRNFHGWGYRRAVIDALEKLPFDGDSESKQHSTAKEELEYTTKMVGANLSNFSAWHNRTKLILRMLNENSASDGERKKTLDDELKLIHRALIDPYDQSLWFYHQNLMCTFDPTIAANTMAPNLSDSERLTYLRDEVEEITDMLDGAEDCKWIYQALLNCNLLISKIEGRVSTEAQENVSKWLSTLKQLDPLRKGRWLDLERSLHL